MSKTNPAQKKPLSRKYKFRPILLNGKMTEVTWLYDHEIDEALMRREGTPINLVKAVELYFGALYDVNTGPNLEVQRLNIIGYAHSQGYRVELFEYLIDTKVS